MQVALRRTVMRYEIDLGAARTEVERAKSLTSLRHATVLQILHQAGERHYQDHGLGQGGFAGGQGTSFLCVSTSYWYSKLACMFSWTKQPVHGKSSHLS